MDLDLRTRTIAAGEKWDDAPKEIIELKELLTSRGKEVHLKPLEFADIMLTRNDDRIHFLQEVLMELYSTEGFWTAASVHGMLHKCLIACKELGIDITAKDIEGKDSMEENYEFWKKVLNIKQTISTSPKTNVSDHPKRETETNYTISDVKRNTNVSYPSPDDEIQASYMASSEYTSDSDEYSTFDRKLSRKISSMTASFTELPDIHGDHVEIDKHGKYIKPAMVSEQMDKNPDLKFGPTLLSDQHTTTMSMGLAPSKSNVKASKAALRTVLARYDKGNSSDESTQAGISSWDWLSRLEQLLIHFFLLIFDASADSTKLMMELMPQEAAQQIEDIFKLLLQAEPEMYENLGHIVGLAEKWLVLWGGDSAKKSKALEFVRMYMLGLKNKRYYLLPVEVRLRQLGTFIAGLKKLEDDGIQVSSSNWNKVIVPSHNLVRVKPLPNSARVKPPSPRVKPAAHFARVVASILCNRTCTKPMTPPAIYADDLAKKVFQTPFHDDEAFQNYIDTKYGSKYVKTDVFFKALPPNTVPPLTAPKKPLPKLHGVKNEDCWLPIFTKAYIKKIKKGKCCKTQGKFYGDYSKSNERLRGNESKTRQYAKRFGGEGKMRYGAQRNERKTREGTWRTGGQTREDTWRTGGQTREDTWRTGGQGREDTWRTGGQGREDTWRTGGQGREDTWRTGGQTREDTWRTGGQAQDDAWRTGGDGNQRVQTRKSKVSRGESRYDSKSASKIRPDEKRQHHKQRGQSLEDEPYNRRPSLDKRSKNRKQNVDGYNSDEEWEHDNNGKRIKRKPGKYAQPGDEDYNSDDDWFHDKSGRRLRSKHPRADGHRPVPGDPDYKSDDEWEHDKVGNRVKRKNPLKGGQRPAPGDIDYDTEDEWEHDKSGNRKKRRDHPKNIQNAPNQGSNARKGDKSGYDSDEIWVHDKMGRRIGKRVKSGDGDNTEQSLMSEIHAKNNGVKTKPQETHNAVGRVEMHEKRKSNGDQYHTRKQSDGLQNIENKETLNNQRRSGEKSQRKQSKSQEPEDTSPALKSNVKYHGGTSRRPSWMSGVPHRSETIKIKNPFLSQTNLSEKLKNLRHGKRPHSVTGNSSEEREMWVNDKPIMPAVSMISSLRKLQHNGKGSYGFEIPGDFTLNAAIMDPANPKSSLKDRLQYLDALYRGERPGEAETFYQELMGMVNPNDKLICSNAAGMDKMTKGNKIGCPESLWGALPIPRQQLLPNDPPKVVEDDDGHDLVYIKSNNVLHEDVTGGQEDYSSIADNVNKYKQIFRDEARAKGLARPSTAEVTSRMIERTTKLAKKKLEDRLTEKEFSRYDPMRRMKLNKIANTASKKLLTSKTNMEVKPSASATEKKKKVRRDKDRLKDKYLSSTKVPLAQSVLELLHKKTDGMSDESEMDEAGDMIRKPRPSPKELHPGVYDDTAKRFHGVMSGPFIPHLDKSRKNRIVFSLAETPTTEYRTVKPHIYANKFSLKKSNSSGEIVEEEDDALEYDELEEEENVKLPSLAVREKVSSGHIIDMKASIVKLPSMNLNGEDEYEDKLLFPNNSNLEVSDKRKSTHPQANSSTRVNPGRNKLRRNLSHLGSDSLLPRNGQGDQVDVNAVNPCWDMTSKMFKSPLKAPAIPLPEHLVIHIEKKFPRLQWPRGVPVALRYYPSGQPFCIVFQNGAGRVHYPHGGLAVAISAPAPHYSRILVIRDPFDQFYFFDKAVLADLNCNGKGAVYDDNGIMKLQYNLQGGYRQEDSDKPSQRWQWNQGGQRFIIKLNRYMALRILDLNKIYIVFYGNKRGFRLNVGAGRRVNLMSVACDSRNKSIPSFQGVQTNTCNGYDYVRGRFSSPVLGFFDSQKTSNRNNDTKERCKTASNYYPPGEATYRYSFSRCNIREVRGSLSNHNCFHPPCKQKC